jgi:hypothetical protein
MQNGHFGLKVEEGLEFPLGMLNPAKESLSPGGAQDFLLVEELVEVRLFPGPVELRLEAAHFSLGRGGFGAVLS